MYAVIQTGGKQYKVAAGDKLKVETLVAEVGATVSFDEVLMVANGDSQKIGTPKVSGAKVMAEVLKHGRGDKIRIIKHRRRKHYHKEQGHRQNYTEVQIKEIVG
ncbi:MAG: 50S ribosomal protein L21 [Gammaproteobacteria bacterium]|nr:50S ribosomal protein L21 [Gammaproteobacteria bacterium]